MKENKIGNDEKMHLKRQITVGVIFIIIGISFLISDFVALKREQTFSKMNLELTELLAQNEDSLEEEEINESENEEEVVEEDNQSNSEDNQSNSDYETYAGILEIPKIGFNKGFYKKESSLNNVKFNIKILDDSSYPDEEHGNVIIIGHSGNYNNSYFANLYQLEKGDQASITYNGLKYTYQIVNIYTQEKDGIVTIYRDETKNVLTLITCTKDDETTQTIYIFELVE